MARFWRHGIRLPGTGGGNTRLGIGMEGGGQQAAEQEGEEENPPSRNEDSVPKGWRRLVLTVGAYVADGSREGAGPGMHGERQSRARGCERKL